MFGVVIMTPHKNMDINKYHPGKKRLLSYVKFLGVRLLREYVAI